VAAANVSDEMETGVSWPDTLGRQAGGGQARERRRALPVGGLSATR
jgi:hypothetical protein